MALRKCTSEAQVSEICKEFPAVVVHFEADWCVPCQHMNAILEQLQVENNHAAFVRVDAEELFELSEKYEIQAVPAFVFLKGSVLCDKLEGANAPELVAKVEGLLKSTSKPMSEKPASSAQPPESLNDRIKKLLASSPVLLFMKGDPQEPRCGFSSKVSAALTECGAKYSTFDILSDEEIRQGLKEYSNWPTYPQLYVDGELIGGCDIILEMHASGELKDAVCKKDALNDRIKKLLASSPVLLFMKGDPQEPRCGFSRKVSAALTECGAKYSTFDILSDEEIRQGLKEYSNWPTYPQLYVDGELIGGCDIILEMHESGELKDAVCKKDALNDRIKKLLASSPVLLFMKGDPQEPRCGFSRKVSAALTECGAKYSTFDILSDEEIRQGLKEYSNWPTYPQLYVDGELIGGCDIILEMHESGELKGTVCRA
ncbi:hypothetical protein CYMTET_13113 [Cymbomonas tetramitiformis]|uniref:Thioredoxin domain-containing protein n=1 Tax=Cymbomonas tetramitiformis TaxID=36881 RepID=A0AAE0GJ41_9CHLO|nr:hypothetical protein CYMTET_13113 [Cymbomonas tetramitiformis]